MSSSSVRRFLFLIALVLGFALPATAQNGFTTITGTVTDPNGIPWTTGTVSAQLITAGGVTPTLNGLTFTSVQAPVTLAGPNGSFTMRLADNGVISPGTTTWQFTISIAGVPPPLGRGPQSYTITTAINCGTNTPATCTNNTISVTSLFTASAPALSFTNGAAGTVNSSGTPTAGQIAAWVNAITVQGLTTLPTTAMPALTGDTTSSAGSLVTTVVGIRGQALPALSPGYPHWNGTNFAWDTPAGTGNVTTSGAPANGNLGCFSGLIVITSCDLAGDVTTSSTSTTTVVKLQGVSLSINSPQDQQVICYVAGSTAFINCYQGIPVVASATDVTMAASNRSNYLRITGGSTANITLTPIAVPNANNYSFVLANFNSGAVTFTASGSDLVDGAATSSLPANWAAFIYSDSTIGPGHWWTIKLPMSAVTTIASGSTALGTGAIAANKCTGDAGQPADVTVSAPGVLTTDVLTAGFNGRPTGIAGYNPGNMLTIIPYPTANAVNFEVCNNNNVSNTPGAVTINYKDVR